MRDRPEPVAVGQDLLRERDELRALGEQEPDGVDQVVGTDVLGVGLVEVEERVAPDHQDEGVLELELVEFDLGVRDLLCALVDLDDSHRLHLTR